MVHRQTGFHEHAQFVAREAKDRTTFLFVAQSLGVLHVGGGKHMGFRAP